MSHIFISYSHKDTVYAHGLAKTLYDDGFEVWIDERLDYGSQWPLEIQKQLDSCGAFIVIMTPRSFASEWVQSELQRAKRKNKPIFPLLLEGDEPWLSVESTQYFDVRGNVFPDSKFYFALKRVITPNPSARTIHTIKVPDLLSDITLEKERPKRKLGLVVGIVGLLLFSFAACGTLLIGSFLGGWFRSSPPLSLASAEPAHLEESLPVPQPSPTPLPRVKVTPETATALPVVIPQSGGEQVAGMALIPAGEFTMGRYANDELATCREYEAECYLDWFQDEEPVHTVYLEAFYMDLYEVTNAQYKACMDEGVCEPPQRPDSYTRSSYFGNPEFDDFPVINVNWYQAQAYCAWRGGRLPSEAEWEKAARGSDGRTYPWGEELDATYTNFNYNMKDTTAVGSYEKGKSPYGLYDMSGNVWEWVVSLHRSYPYTANDGREAASVAGQRVFRGGSWGYVGVSVSAAYRNAGDPSESNLDLGFRCARDAAP